MNVKAGHEEFALFEIGKVHIKGFEDDGLPVEFDRAAAIFAADKKPAGDYAGAAYYQARRYLVELLRAFGISDVASFEPLTAEDKDSATAYYAPGRAAVVKVGDVVVARVGEYTASVRKAFKLPEFCAGFELGLKPLHDKQATHTAYVALPRFPRVEQDICLRVASDLSYQELFQFVENHLHQNRPDKTWHTLGPVDIYQREEDKTYKQVTLRLSLASYERTLTDQEVNGLLEQVAAAAKETFGAERV